MATPFTFALGTRQGRIQPTGFAPADGDFAFVLGSDQPGEIFALELGDSVEVLQMVDVTAANFVRVVLHMRNAAQIPAGRNWEVSVVVDGTKQARMVMQRGRTRTRTDLAANVSKLTGIHTIGFRLELIAE